MSKKPRVKGKGADIFFSEKETKEDAQPFTSFEGKPVDTELIKATFYFTQSQIDALEKAVFALRQEHRIKTNKSEVMRIALDEIIRKFEENQSDSALLKRLA